jgi:hypothetical protein
MSNGIDMIRMPPAAALIARARFARPSVDPARRSAGAFFENAGRLHDLRYATSGFFVA